MNWQIPKLSGTPDAIKAQLEREKVPQAIKDLVISEVISLPKATVLVISGFSADHKDTRGAGILRQIEIAIKTFS